jgi:HEAT repeat protein
MTLSQRLWALVNVRPEEAPIVRLVLLLAALIGVTRLLGSTAAFALFLDRFDAQRLPWIYIGSSIVVTLVSLLYLRLERRYSLAHLIIGLVGLILLTLLGYRLGLLAGNASWLIFSLPVYDGVVSALLFTAFWNLLGRLFNLQQGKRLFGLFGAGQEVAVIAIGLVLPLLVTGVGTANLLWGALLTGLAALAVLWTVIRRAPLLWLPGDEDDEADAPVDAPPKRNWIADPYVLLIFAMYLCFGLGDYFVDNIFYARVEGQLTDPNQLAGFLGLVAAVVSGLSLCSHLFLSGYMFRRYGVRTVILLTPFLLFVIGGLFVGSGLLGGSSVLLFWLAVALNLTGRVTDAFDNPAANLLYQPLPPTVRMRTQTIIDGILYPASGGAAGLLLLVLTNGLHFDSLQLGYVLMPILALWLGATVALGRVYPRRIQQALRQRFVHGNGGFAPDRDSLTAIQQQLHSPHPGVVLYALDLLTTHDPATVHARLPALVTHTAVAVRLAAINQIEATGATAYLPLLEELSATDPADGVRSAALRALTTLGGLTYNEQLLEQLTVAAPQLRQGLMIGLLRSGELDGILAVGAQLTQLVHSSCVTERTFAAHVLGESGIASLYRPLLQLLHDPEPTVRRAALAAAGKLQQPKLWPGVVDALATTATRSAAQSALVAGGDSTLPALAAGWAAATHEPALRSALARTCGRLRSAGAAALLRTAIDDPNVTVRTQILAALHQCGYQATPAERAQLEAAIHAELAFAAWTLAGMVDLAADPTLVVVYGALAASLRQQQSRLLFWLSLLYDPAVIRRVREILAPPVASTGTRDPEQLAYALEALDLAIAGPSKAPLLTLYDEQPPLAKLNALAPLAPQERLDPAARIHAIISGPPAWVTPWLHATALYQAPTVAAVAPRARVALLHEAVSKAVNTTNALVGESARWATRQLTVNEPVALAAADD